MLNFHDRSPCHNSRIVKSNQMTEKFQVIHKPSNIPDFNPFENMRCIENIKVTKLHPYYELHNFNIFNTPQLLLSYFAMTLGEAITHVWRTEISKLTISLLFITYLIRLQQ